jgi:hypothetical protein
MDVSTLKDSIKNALVSRKIDFTEAALDRLVAPQYVKAGTLEEVSDKQAQSSVEKVVDACVKKLHRRNQRSKVEGVKLREIDTRTVARQAAEDNLLPWGSPKKPKEEAEAPGEEADGNEEAAAEAKG